jgi:hypothetical protein
VVAASSTFALERIAATPPGRVETGTPSFVVIRPEGMGLTSAPTDLQLMPDGRILVVSSQEIVLGDGVRWATNLRDPSAELVNLENVAVDADGAIYAATPGSFSRIDFMENGRWKFSRVANLPDAPTLRNRTLLRVAKVGETWLWHTGSGPIVQWRPGAVPRLIGTINDLERAFSADGRIFISDASNGMLHVLNGDRLEAFPLPANPSLAQAVTCAMPLPGARTLLGTNSVGAQVLEGDRLVEFRPAGPLDGRHRINDLCPLEGGLFAAALDHLGIAIFDTDGRLVEVIDRTIQHQLAHVRRVIPAPGGTVWVLLADGIACVDFPAQVTSIDPLVTTGITFSVISRHQGCLWIVSDGKAQRAEYDADGRLLRFEVDGPDASITSLCTSFDTLVACGTQGIYLREAGGWRLAIPGITGALICADAEPDGRHVYVARQEIGTFRMTATGPEIERIAFPELGDPYVGVYRAGSDYWTELGSGRVARIRMQGGKPVARVFGIDDGLRDSWAQLFIIDGIARFNLGGRVFRLDEATQRFVVDESVTELCGAPIAGHGRPARDSAGRIW